jgi:hypothetical protein
MFSKISCRLQRLATEVSRKRARCATVQAASVAAAEFLERRCLLSFSLSAGTLEGPINTAGSTWTYERDRTDGGVSVEVITIGSPATFQGHSAVSLTDNTTVTAPGNPPTTTEIDSIGYGAILATGPVLYGATETTSEGTGTLTYSPFAPVLPAVMTVGVAYTFNYAELAPDGSTVVNVTDVDTLVSSSTTSVPVPAGTFNCYEVDQTITQSTPPGATPLTTTKKDAEFCAPGIGVVEKLDTSDGVDAAPLKLTNVVTKKDTLKFQQGPTETQAGNAIKPPIVVEIDHNGTLDSAGGDSTDFVTLTISGGGTLGGTTMVQAVGGLATFSDITIPAAGDYTLTASSDPMSPVPSSVTIDASTPSDLTPTLQRLKVPTTAVGGGPVNINANVNVSNDTASTVTGFATVAAMLVGPNNVNSAVVHPGDSFVAPDTVSLQIGKTVREKVNIKSHKSGTLKIHLASLPNVAVAGSYSLEFVVTDPQGNTATVIGPSITVGPAVITLTETIAALKLPSTITIGQKLKAASIKLIVKNSGNVIAKGKTTFSVSASTVSGVVGTTIATSSVVLNTAPGKTKPVSINIKSLPALAAGSYFIVVQATDSMGNKSIVSSASPITVTA